MFRLSSPWADWPDWFWLEYGDLDWFADLKGLGYKTSHSQFRALSLPDPSEAIR